MSNQQKITWADELEDQIVREVGASMRCGNIDTDDDIREIVSKALETHIPKDPK